jgi:hypothetical protein
MSEMIYKIPGMRYFKVISITGLEGLRKTTKSHSQYSRVTQVRFEPGTSILRTWSVKHSNSTLGDTFINVQHILRQTLTHGTS